MTRVVVHIGSQRIASMAIPRGLYENQDLLAQHGVLVPMTARHDLSPIAVRHHMLAWSLDPDGDHPFDPDVWKKLADEMSRSAAPTVLLSSELLAGVAGHHTRGSQLRDRLAVLSDDVTVAFIAREQLGLLNSLYTQRVRALELTYDFDTYLEQSPDLRFCKLMDVFGPWFDDERLRFVAMPWDGQPDDAALPSLLSLCGIEVPAEALDEAEGSERDELGAAGVAATRVLGAYLRGRYANFSYGEPAARKLRRRVAAMAEGFGWNNADFWGWSEERSAAVVDEFAASNEEFARRAWGGPWSISSPTRPRHVLDVADLDPADANRLHHYVTEHADLFARMRFKEGGP